MSLLEVQQLSRRFGGLVAVKDVDFDVNEGEILAVIGPNGAGKSTLFKLITSFLRPSSGRVVFRGEVPSGPGYWYPATLVEATNDDRIARE